MRVTNKVGGRQYTVGGEKEGRIEQERELFNLAVLMNIQFYWSKFTELLTNIMGKVYIANRAKNTHMHITLTIVYFAMVWCWFYFTLLYPK